MKQITLIIITVTFLFYTLIQGSCKKEEPPTIKTLNDNYPFDYIHCDSDSPTAVVDVVNPSTGRIWMDRNLGASRVATSSTDAAAFGDLYQWGRFADGHQCRTSATNNIIGDTDLPGNKNFILAPNNPYDWRSPQNDKLWQGINGINNPCPIGYRVPTEAELEAERNSWSSNDATGAFTSPLKLPAGGRRKHSDGSLKLVGSGGHYWSSTVSGTYSWQLAFHNEWSHVSPLYRGCGLSVRCIKADQPPLKPSPINGPVSVCKNATGLVYQIIQEANVVYTWSVPTGWSIASGQGTHEITLNIGTSSGTIKVTPTNNDGAGPSQTLAVKTQVCTPSPLYKSGFVHCDIYNPTPVVDVTNPTTGKTWMDRNMGASHVATSSTDRNAYGDLYQWGRFADGHQCRTSVNTANLSNSDVPGHGDFITSSQSALSDWRSPQNDNLWQGVNGVNNPCPIGYRIPTEAELNAERQSWKSNNATGAFESPLKLPVAGGRSYYYYSEFLYIDIDGYFWSSTTFGTTSQILYILSNNDGILDVPRAYGLSVRCIKD